MLGFFFRLNVMNFKPVTTQSTLKSNIGSHKDVCIKQIIDMTNKTSCDPFLSTFHFSIQDKLHAAACQKIKRKAGIGIYLNIPLYR